MIVVDPGQSQPVIDYIIKHGLILHSILITHTHHDHIGGLAELLSYFNHQITVYGSFPDANIFVKDKQAYTINNQTVDNINILAVTTSGHTVDGFSYLINNEHLFCGDTLFAAGCGRVFTLDYVAMYNSLNKIKQLNHNTLIYPAHEYTLSNLIFAKYLEPNNQDILNRYRVVCEQRQKDENTLPTTLGMELKTNPFLRCAEVQIIPACEMGLEQFIKIRKLKDSF